MPADVMKMVDVSKDKRLFALDLARGCALALMLFFHFSWDLQYFGFVAWPVQSGAGWVLFAQIIAGSFLFLSGFSLAISASRSPFGWRRYWWRLAKIGCAAAAISLATYFAFGAFMVRFGILHAIAVGSLLCLPFLWIRWYWASVAAVIVWSISLVLPDVLASYASYLFWIGLSEPVYGTVDFVPVFPWFALLLFGVSAAKVIRLPTEVSGSTLAKNWRFMRVVALAGRHSLLVYLVHQPLLYGIVYCFARILYL
ncbi:heparan-alpha-glucosaminide N-acetyltransferase [Polycladidibacter hongkongensis]|uniref:heparan-alpha-glucosaminide N-acetyltransferase n=1 Tax=Polycladidibacter hongkongensis TaxID=1647556 RepID=UPI00082CB057|nr:heparan-alpha-glucosaminide N-acetyltransferase [Pseudovibrio hongkongensis]